MHKTWKPTIHFKGPTKLNPTAIAAFVIGVILVTRGHTLEGTGLILLSSQIYFELGPPRS